MSLPGLHADMDQSPRLVHKRQEVQGIANMYQSGPDDGGLVVVRGSHKLHRSYFDHAGKFTEDEEPQQEQKGGQHFEYDELEWYKENGAEIVKVCANEGDLIRESKLPSHFLSLEEVTPAFPLHSDCAPNELDRAVQRRNKSLPWCLRLPMLHA